VVHHITSVRSHSAMRYARPSELAVVTGVRKQEVAAYRRPAFRPRPPIAVAASPQEMYDVAGHPPASKRKDLLTASPPVSSVSVPRLAAHDDHGELASRSVSVGWSPSAVPLKLSVHAVCWAPVPSTMLSAVGVRSMTQTFAWVGIWRIVLHLHLDCNAPSW